MFGRYLTLTFRTLRRNLLYTVIVIGGLVLGITTFLAIIQWSSWHFSYDRHFPASDQIYRLSIKEKRENFERHTARIIHGDVVKQLFNDYDIPEIDKIARLAPFRNAIVRKDEIVYYEDKTYACDNEFIQLFQPEMLFGNIQRALDGPFRVIISEETARKYFGEEDPVGQSIEIVHQFGFEGDEYEITGIFKTYPKNTHFEIDILTSFDNPFTYSGTAWVYLLLEENADPRQLELQLQKWISENNEAEYAEGISPSLLPLVDIHLKSHLASELDKNVPFFTLVILSTAGLLVFMLAWFNFTLLSISQNQLNLKRLIFQWQMGSGRRAFFKQFLVEFLTIGLIAYSIALLLSALINIPLENTFGVSLVENISLLAYSLLSVILLIFFTSFATALFATQRLYSKLKVRYFTAHRMTRNPVKSKNLFIRSVILIEFIITFTLVTNLLMVREQVIYGTDLQLGANDSTTIQLANLPRPVIDKYPVFKKELSKYPSILEITAMMEEPGGMAMDAFNYRIEALPEIESRLFVFPVDEDFIRFYDLTILAGEDFPAVYDREDTTEYFMLNETAAKQYNIENYEDMLGRQLTIDFAVDGFIYPGNIIGVIEDFHLSGMETALNPMVIFPEYTWLYCISIRTDGNVSEALKNLRETWQEFFPDYPLQYQMTTEIYKNLYEAHYTVLKLLIVFSILSILIAGTGLFALSAFFMQQKMHAAAIRKISGAGIARILIPELRQYLVLALLSSVLAMPLSLYSINQWLDNFAFQANIPAWIFVSIALLIIAFSWIAVLYHSVRLARLNPVNFIRNE